MRLLFLNHNVIWRSTFFRCYHFGRYLVRKGHEVTIYTIHPNKRSGIEEIDLQGVKVVQFPDLFWGIGRSGWDLWDLWVRQQYMKKEKYDLVHAFDSRPVVVHPAMTLKKQGVPMVMDWADWWGRGGVIEERSNKLIKYLFGPIETWYEEHFRTKADATTVISSALQERVTKLGVDSQTITKLWSGADTETLKVTDKATCREKLGIEKDLKIAGFMGFVHYDLELVLRSFAKIYKQDKHCRLMLAGKPNSMVERIGREENMEEGIINLGVVPYDQLPAHMGCADVFLLPFTNKIANLGRWPNKVGDYMAMGRPIVTSAIGEMKELFTKEPIGVLTEDNIDDFADKTLALLQNKDQCDRLGRQAREAAEKRYSWEILTETLEQSYRKLF